MSKLSHLQPFKEPPPVERESCRACRTFAPEVLVPDGDGAIPMCWLCAHHVVEHGSSMDAARCGECECTPQEIYPQRAFAPPGQMLASGFRLEHGDVTHDQIKNACGNSLLRGHTYNPKTKTIELAGDFVCNHKDPKKCSGCRGLSAAVASVRKH